MTTMNEIEAAAKAVRAARDLVAQRATMLSASIEELKRKHTPGLRNAVEKQADAEAKLLALLQSAPELFKKPKSHVFHGLQVGYKAGAGSLVIDDAARVVKAIHKHLPDQAESLIKTKETPIKAAIAQLTGADLKKIGVTVNPGGEVVYLKDTLDAVDKLVASLLKGAEAEQEEAEEAEA